MSKRKKENTKQNVFKSLAASVAICITLVGALLFYSNILEKNLYSDSISKLSEISEQNVKILNSQINSQMESMTEISARIAVPSNWDIDYTMYTLNKVMERYPFKRMGIIFPDGTSYVTNGETYVIPEEQFEYIESAFEGENVISNIASDAFDGDKIISLQVPVYKDSEIVAVLTASYEPEILQEMLSVSFFNGQGYSYIVRSTGDIVADSSHPTSFQNVVNIFTSLNESNESNASVSEEMKNHMQLNENGYINFTNDVNKYMYYSSVGINDWYLLSVIPTSVIDSTRSDIMNSTYILCLAIILIFVIIVLYSVNLERKKRSELQQILYVDPITQGYSFQRFCIEAKQHLEKDDRQAAVIVLDIEKFKVINEMFGYEEGDRVLQYIWSLLREWVRDDEIYSRWIADRFNILAYYESEDELIERLNALAADIMNNRTEKRNGFIIRPVIGVYRVINRTLDIQTMQNYASIAHSTIKGGSGSGCIAFYDEEYKNTILNNKILEDQLVTALEKEEFVVFYQPKYDTVSKELVGAEALVRWKKPDGTYIPPYKFIPTAEKNGFIIKLDKYVFNRVCQDQRRWLEEGKRVVPVSVNLSRQHLYNSEFINDYSNMVEKSGVPIDKLELEITESAMFENQDEFLSIIDRLHGIGFRILMDDFGTGYSSLMMLKSIPIDVMKLDKSFVDDYNNEKGEKIISSVTQLAKSMHIEVTAEGVETEEQYEFMKNLGCDNIQGFYFARPMPQEDFDALLEKKSS